MLRFADNISAGFPSAAEGYEDEQLNVHTFLVRNEAATFFWRVYGNDLAVDHHLVHGAILVVDRSITPSRGKLVIARVEGDDIVCAFEEIYAGVVLGVVVGSFVRR